MFLTLPLLLAGLSMGLNPTNATLTKTNMNFYDSDPYNPNIYCRLQIDNVPLGDYDYSLNLSYDDVNGVTSSIDNFIKMNLDYEIDDNETLHCYFATNDYSDYFDTGFPQINYALYYRVWYRSTQQGYYRWTAYASPLYLWYDYAESFLDIQFVDHTSAIQLELQFHYYDLDVYTQIIDGYGSSTDSYQNGYQYGYDVGKNEGYTLGFASGKDTGYSEGINVTSQYDFIHLFGAIADTPIMILRNLLGFEVFGVKAISILMTMITGTIAIFLIRKFI